MLWDSIMTIEFKHLLVAIDFGAPSHCALDAAIALARRFDARVTLVHVFEIPAYAYGEFTYATSDMFGAMEKLASEALEKTRREVEQQLPETTAVLRCGLAAPEILSVIEKVHPDLVVVGTHGRTGVKHVFLGSVAEKIVRLSPVPVLTIHGEKRE
jgi:nucleotide-binding universal stress UspA family protein